MTVARDPSASSTNSRRICAAGWIRFTAPTDSPAQSDIAAIAPVVVLSGTQAWKRGIGTRVPSRRVVSPTDIALEGFGCRDGRAQNAVGRVGPADGERFGVGGVLCLCGNQGGDVLRMRPPPPSRRRSASRPARRPPRPRVPPPSLAPFRCLPPPAPAHQPPRSPRRAASLQGWSRERVRLLPRPAQ